MRVVHFSALGADTGAGRAAYNIHKSVLASGCDSSMVVENASGVDQRVASAPSGLIASFRGRAIAKKQKAAFQRLNPSAIFHPDEFARLDSQRLRLTHSPDIIHLHWIAGFLNTAQISKLWNRFQVPIVWTVMDCAPFSGGCHYTNGCERYTANCGGCPVLGSTDSADASHKSLESKGRGLHGIPITLTGATQWVADRAAKSSLFSHLRYVKIPYGVDSRIFRPQSKTAVREALGLPADARIVFFGATDHAEPRKGMRYAVEALNMVAAQRRSSDPRLVALIAGASDGEYTSRLNLDCAELGVLRDDRLLAMCYQAADVFMCPSVDDAGPQMIPESLMCGTPVVAFAGCGGVEDFIRAGVNGYAARDCDAADLASALSKALGAVASGEVNTESCRAIALQECTMEIQGTRYKQLYQELVARSAN